MEDLGIVSSRADSPPRNIAEDARVFGGSLFDSVIAVRDNLYQGDTIDLGGQALGGVDSALNNLLGNLGKLGAQDARLELAFERTQGEILDTTDQLSREIDVDVAETVTELRMLEYTHRVALQTAARIVPQTLLDFLR
jgi:flagellar hook-associated protein 3 FlgL